MGLYKTEINMTLYSSEELKIDMANMIGSIQNGHSIKTFQNQKYSKDLNEKLADKDSDNLDICIGNLYWLEDYNKFWIVTAIDDNIQNPNNFIEYRHRLIYGKTSRDINLVIKDKDNIQDKIQQIREEIGTISTDDIILTDNKIIFNQLPYGLRINMNNINNMRFNVDQCTLHYGFSSNDKLRKKFICRLSDAQIIKMLEMIDTENSDTEE